MTCREETTVFVHIPRTAGTTLHRIIERHYRARELYSLGPGAQAGIARFNRMDPARARRYRMIKGHLAFGRPERLAEPVRWITMLRDPIERAASFFRYVQGHPTHYLNTWIDPEMDLVSFVQSQTPLMMDNAQTRMISGVWLDPPFGACTQAMLDQAKANLESRFAVVGLTERFDETLLLLQRALGWQWLNYRRLNASSQHGGDSHRLSSEERLVLETTNKLDCELYRFAAHRFAHQIQSYGPDFHAALENFQAHNEPYSTGRELYWMLRSRSVTHIAQAVVRRLTARLGRAA